MERKNVLKIVRTTHLYFGVLITPAILFFALSGALQTFDLHETNRNHPTYTPPHWMVVLGQLHKKQTIVVQERRPPAPAGVAPAAAPVQAPPVGSAGFGEALRGSLSAARREGPAAGPKHNLVPMKIFFLLVSAGLTWSTFTGLFMAYAYLRNRLLVSLTLAAGVALPVLFLFF